MGSLREEIVQQVRHEVISSVTEDFLESIRVEFLRQLEEGLEDRLERSLRHELEDETEEAEPQRYCVEDKDPCSDQFNALEKNLCELKAFIVAEMDRLRRQFGSVQADFYRQIATDVIATLTPQIDEMIRGQLSRTIDDRLREALEREFLK
jgi:hypothetical protein